MNREMLSDCFLLCCKNQGFINNKIPVCVISLIGTISETITLWLATVKSVSNIPTGIFIKAVWIVLSAELGFVPQQHSCLARAAPCSCPARDALWSSGCLGVTLGKCVWWQGAWLLSTSLPSEPCWYGGFFKFLGFFFKESNKSCLKKKISPLY